MALTPAEKQAAYRERKRAELADVEVPSLDEIVAAAVVLEGVERAGAQHAGPAPVPRELPISEDAYVKLMLAEPNILDRKRAARYARWRYKGVLEGKVASL